MFALLVFQLRIAFNSTVWHCWAHFVECRANAKISQHPLWSAWWLCRGLFNFRRKQSFINGRTKGVIFFLLPQKLTLAFYITF